MTALALCVTPSVLLAGPAHAADSDVTISEIMYHAPDTDAQFANLEFIELTNAGSAPVDLSGWSFTAGITLATADAKFPAGTAIPAGGRLVGTSDPALFQAKYGFAADFSYAGTSLSNGGEQVTLSDAAATVVDDVTYDDADPWPITPDGGGPSLELDSLSADNSLAASWHASSVDFGTPREVNSTPPLALTDVAATPNSPAPGQAVVVQAKGPVGSTMTLTYKVMYAADVSVPMLDDAASPGGAGDGVYAETIPGSGEGNLLRYKISLTKSGSTATYPAAGDSRPYDGVVVQDSDTASAKFPVLQWFMPDATYNDMITNHRCDDVQAPATFAWNGKVLDGGLMRIKGHHTCQDAKAKWDVDLPAGYSFDFGGPFAYPVDEFDLQNEAIPTPRLGWEMIAQSGEEAPAYETMRVQRNGNFHGDFGVLEGYDGTWRSNHGYKDGELYKVEAGGLRTYPTAAALAASGDLEKKNPDDADYTAAWELTQWLAKPNGPAKTAWMQAHFDLSQVANYTALTVVMRHWDSSSKNYYLARDPDTMRWQILSWDLDGIFNSGRDNKGDLVFPPTESSPLWQSLAALPGFKEQHFRRVRTLSDKFLVGDGLVNRFDQLTVPYASDIALDVAKWGKTTLAGGRKQLISGIQERRTQIANHSSATEIPPSQVAGQNLVINEINYQPAAGGSEYLELYNPNNTAVDLSGWTVPAMGLTAQPGTVIRAHGYLVWDRDDAAFVSTYGGDAYMAEEYSEALNDSGGEVALFDGARLVDSVTYAPTSPWPAADGTGHSLELKSPTLDNADPANWVASSGAGSPGLANGAVTPPGDQAVVDYGQSWKYLSTSADQGTAWRAPGYDDSAWAAGNGGLGFNNAQATVIPSATGRITYYFRKSFTVTAGSPVTAVTLNIKRDDGAVVYLNGVEVARSNMPTGAVNFRTKALLNMGAAGGVKPVTFTLPTSSVAVGQNTIAVEVHQKASGSGADLYFDGNLTLTR